LNTCWLVSAVSNAPCGYCGHFYQVYRWQIGYAACDPFSALNITQDITVKKILSRKITCQRNS
jgi:hypothetical protein